MVDQTLDLGVVELSRWMIAGLILGIQACDDEVQADSAEMQRLER